MLDRCVLGGRTRLKEVHGAGLRGACGCEE